MKAVLIFCLVLFGLVIGGVAFAQEVADAVAPPSPEEWMAFFASLGGLKGASAMVIAMAVSQGAMLIVKAKASLTGRWQLVVLGGLTLVISAVSLKIADPSMHWAIVLMNGAVMTAMQNFGHQIFKQVVVKKD